MVYRRVELGRQSRDLEVHVASLSFPRDYLVRDNLCGPCIDEKPQFARHYTHQCLEQLGLSIGTSQ